MRYYPLFVLIGSLLLSSCSIKEGDVKLSPFSRDFIESYIDNYPKYYVPNLDELYMYVSQDKDYYYMSVWGDETPKRPIFNSWYPFTLSRYLGKVFVGGKPVYVGGPLKSIFYKARYHRASPIQGEPCEYDPIEWHITIRKTDTTYCCMKSSTSNPYSSISVIDSIALKYYKPSIMTGDEVYPPRDLDKVARPTFSYEESQELINTRYSFKERLPLDKCITIGLLVDKKGNASLYKVEEKSGIKRFDKEALRMAKEICNYPFRPAQIRGQDVNTIYYLCFCDKGLMNLW